MKTEQREVKDTSDIIVEAEFDAKEDAEITDADKGALKIKIAEEY